MKRKITQLLMTSAFLLIGSGAYAQCTGSVYIKNKSNDDWTVSYYNNDLVVPAQSDATLGYINANPNIGRGVLQTANTSCNHKFQTNPDIWNAPCTFGTSLVYYQATLDLNGCYNSGVIYILP
ncbi:MAG: hypothetical protein HRT58_13055 [Crocinitomicaceae bacterium]|nr:hypothetical protein [Flavobacteriales bacterium]NQZ36594.1 hypothetical protein [Crocinitomicaceae bacterium]